MRGGFFKRIKDYTNNKHQQDYIFADYDTEEAVSRKLLY